MTTEALAAAANRLVLVRRGLWLNYVTIGYNTIEAVVALSAGLVAGSVALIGFGVDSVIEVSASVIAQWRLRADLNPARRERVEYLAVRIIGGTFLALAAYVDLRQHHHAGEARRAGRQRGRRHPALDVGHCDAPPGPGETPGGRRPRQQRADGGCDPDLTLRLPVGHQPSLELPLNTLLGWWWADPAAALAMVPIIVKEGVEGLRGESACAECATDHAHR